MKKGIHPDYREVTFTCACGFTVKTRSTAGDRMFDICSNCHPLYTGRQKLVDTAGRVDRYRKKYGQGTTRKSD
ncbi:50S ribosomal protein L31 [Candidatus Fermentibacterales bacterium]|nr:50S ribosomal protein L31 [Candidatus Fermentibacterales bacterium]